MLKTKGKTMALNYDYSKLSDEVKATRTGLIDTLIYQTMAVGMHEITEKNWQEFYARVMFLESLYGKLMNKGSEPYFIKPEDIQQCIGLKTNASDWTRTKFVKVHTTGFFKDIESRLQAPRGSVA